MKCLPCVTGGCSLKMDTRKWQKKRGKTNGNEQLRICCLQLTDARTFKGDNNLYSHSSRCSSQWRRCAWRDLEWLQPGAVPRGSRALKAACCRLGARRRLAGQPVEGPHRYSPRAERPLEAYTRLPPGNDTHVRQQLVSKFQRTTLMVAASMCLHPS